MSQRSANAFGATLAGREPTLTIGELDGADEYGIGGVEKIVLDAAGNFVVADGVGRDVRVYGTDGEYVQTIGSATVLRGRFPSLRCPLRKTRN